MFNFHLPQGLVGDTNHVSFIVISCAVGLFGLWVVLARDHPEKMTQWREEVYVRAGSFTLAEELIMGASCLIVLCTLFSPRFCRCCHASLSNEALAEEVEVFHPDELRFAKTLQKVGSSRLKL